MAACRNVGRLPFIFSLVICCFAQETPQHPRQTNGTSPEKVSLAEVSTVQVPSLPAESVVAPLLCDPEGGILLRLAMPDSGIEDPISISRDGKTVIRFGKEKINDISRPRLSRMYLSGSDVYVLASGSIPLGYETRWRTPKGEVVSQPATKSSTFVARFDRDGRYRGAVPLDLPFSPQQLGVFDNGDFLITGIDMSRTKPQLAIVSSNGQLRRFVELSGDVHTQEESDQSAKSHNPTAFPRFESSPGSGDSLFDVVSTSQIATDGTNLLLFRPLKGPVFSVSPSGEVRVHKLKVEGDYRLYTVKATRDAWIVEFIHDVPHSGVQEFSTYAFDPRSDAPLREYFFPKDMGWGLACADGDEFTFVMADSETKSLKFVTLAPGGRSN
jgi:hypothetical protein